MNPRILEIHGARNDIINDCLIKLELTIVIDVPPARSRAWAQKGKLISQNCGICYATRRPGPKLFPPLLPSAITNESPVIENNRCVRVMPPEDRVLARGSASIYELAESAGTPSTRELGDDNQAVHVQSALPLSCANLSNNLRFRAPSTTTSIHTRSFLHQRRLSPSSLFFFFLNSRCLVCNSHPIYVPQNCKVHYRITT